VVAEIQFQRHVSRVFLVRLERCGSLFGVGDFFGVGDDGGELRVSVERVEIWVLRHSQVSVRFKAVIDGLRQVRNCLRLVALVSLDAAQVVSGHRGTRVFRPQDPLFTMPGFEILFLRFRILTLFRRSQPDRAASPQGSKPAERPLWI
jgi:hypothetical protein